MVEPSIDFSSEELVVLARHLAIAPPRTAGDLSLVSDDATAVARRSLVARRIVSSAPAGDGEPIVAAAQTPESRAREAVRDLVYLICVPSLSVEISCRTEEADDTWFILAQPEAAVEQAVVCDGVFRFTPFRAEEIPGRLQLRTQLSDRPTIGDGILSLPRSLLMRIRDLADSGARDEALQLCRGRDDESLMSQLVEALAACKAFLAVTVMNFGAGSTVEGGVVSWADAGELGLWRLPDAGSLVGEVGDELVDVFPTSKAQLLADLASFFPSSSQEAARA
ncbi:MAG: hypothetical protein ACYDEY_00020 [Acidimicrobiales bacterium]